MLGPWIVEHTWKKGPTVRVFQSSPPRLVDSAITECNHWDSAITELWLSLSAHLSICASFFNLWLTFKISVDWNSIYQHFLVHPSLCSYLSSRRSFVLGWFCSIFSRLDHFWQAALTMATGHKIFCKQIENQNLLLHLMYTGALSTKVFLHYHTSL